MSKSVTKETVWDEYAKMGDMSVLDFVQVIIDMNSMYSLPVAPHTFTDGEVHFAPGLHYLRAGRRERILNFYDVMHEEGKEALKMLRDSNDLFHVGGIDAVNAEDAVRERTERVLSFLTDANDWLGDVLVYAVSESVKYGVADRVLWLSPNIEKMWAASTRSTPETKVDATVNLNGAVDGILSVLDTMALSLHQIMRFGGDTEATEVPDEVVLALTHIIESVLAAAFKGNVYVVSDGLPFIALANRSKLGADGKPILDERGKFQKGPNTFKPEPFIREHLSRIFYQEVAHHGV